MRRNLLTLLVMTLVAASGCAVKEPATSLPEDFPEQDSWAASADDGEVRDRWWEAFNSLELDLAIRQSLERNHRLDAAVARIDAAMAAARIAGADLYPNIGAGVSTSRSARYLGFDVPGLPPTSQSTIHGVSLNLSWEADIWGRIRAGREAALTDIVSAEAAWHGARLSLSGQTAKAWLSVVEAAQQVRLNEETVASYQESVKWISARYKVGLVNALDLRLARLSLVGAEAALEQSRARYEQALRQLEYLVGAYPAGEMTHTFTFPPMPERVPAGLPADIIDRRPDVRGARLQLAASGYRLQEAERSLYPQLSLSASGGTNSSELEDLVDGDFAVWNLAANLMQPIFQGGRLRANVALQEARQREALANFADTVLMAYTEVETALSIQTILADAQAAVERTVEEARGAEALAREQYRAGLGPYLNVLESQRSVLNAESQLITLRRQRLDARIDLFLALGGSFELPEEPLVTGETTVPRAVPSLQPIDGEETAE